jgi:hypothetical protein
MKSGRNATAAANARFHVGARKRLPAVHMSTMSRMPHNAEGSRIAHSDCPKAATAAAIR